MTSGWEDPYSVELLATVLYAARSHPHAATDPNVAADYLHQWNARKQATFPGRPRHQGLATAPPTKAGWRIAGLIAYGMFLRLAGRRSGAGNSPPSRDDDVVSDAGGNVVMQTQADDAVVVWVKRPVGTLTENGA